MRYQAVIAYDGAAYQGFQRQAMGIPSVQATVEEALTAVLGNSTRLLGAARTDTGVHALGQVIAFDAQWRHDESTLRRALNATLPDDIAIQRLAGAAPDFHPRFDAHSRTYRYQVYEAEIRQPLYRRNTWQVYGKLDLDAMNRAAALVLGEHNFATFGMPTQGESTLRTVYGAQWLVLVDTAPSVEALADRLVPAARLLSFWIEANGFLQHMVRVLVGALVDVGWGKWTIETFAQAFRTADRSQAQQMAPPHGLTLMAVSYLPASGDSVDFEQENVSLSTEVEVRRKQENHEVH